MIKFFLTRVLKWALSIDWKTFLKVIPILQDAAAKYPKPDKATDALKTQINISRAVYASDEIARELRLPAASAGVNFLREIGLLWLRKES